MSKKKKKQKPNYRVFKTNPVFFGDTEEEKARKDELKNYREEHPKPWYL